MAARGGVAELGGEVGQHLLHHAVVHRTIPKGVDDRLVVLGGATTGNVTLHATF